MELQSTDPWEVAYRELADETSSGLFPERRVFDVNVENWKVTYEESPDDLTVKQYLQMRLAAVVRLTSDLGPARVISTPSQTESRPVFDYKHPAYLNARRGAFKRSAGICQFCGYFEAELAHHWAVEYPAEEDTTADDLTALCGPCQIIARELRATLKATGNKYEFASIFYDALRDAIKGPRRPAQPFTGPRYPTREDRQRDSCESAES